MSRRRKSRGADAVPADVVQSALGSADVAARAAGSEGDTAQATTPTVVVWNPDVPYYKLENSLTLAPAGARRVNSASMFIWTSSSSGFHWNLPSLISLPMAVSALEISFNSPFVNNPTSRSISCWCTVPGRR